MARRRRRSRDEIEFDKEMKMIGRFFKGAVRGLKAVAKEVEREQRRQQREALRIYNSLSDEERAQVDYAIEQERIAKEKQAKETRDGCIMVLLAPFLLVAITLGLGILFGIVMLLPLKVITIPALMFLSIWQLHNSRQLSWPISLIWIILLLEVTAYPVLYFSVLRDVFNENQSATSIVNDGIIPSQEDRSQGDNQSGTIEAQTSVITESDELNSVESTSFEPVPYSPVHTDGEGYSLNPFDSTVTRIIPDYLGHSIEALCDELETIPPSDINSDLKLLENVTLDSTLTFVFRPEEDLAQGNQVKVRTSYEARKRNYESDETAHEANSVVETSRLMDLDRFLACQLDQNYYVVPVDSNINQDSIHKYAGNVFVDELFKDIPSKTRIYSILIENRHPTSRVSTICGWKINDIAQDVASKLENKVGVVCVCKLGKVDLSELKEPELANYISIIDRKIGSKRIKFKFLYVHDVEFWLIDLNSGNIIARYSVDDSMDEIVEKEIDW